MSTLTSSSTLAQVEAAYDDNASYFEDFSVAKARAFVTAAKILLRRYAERATHGPVTLQRRLDLIQRELRQAQRWLNQNDTARQGPQVTGTDFGNFRGLVGDTRRRGAC